MKKLVRALFAALLLLIGLPFLVAGMGTAIYANWEPVRELDRDEMERIAAVAQYVSKHTTTANRFPTAEEFDAWKERSPESLRLRGSGFNYEPPSKDAQRAYKLSFWDGDNTITWHSEPVGNTAGEIDPEVYFSTGSKLTDLLVYFGIAALFFGVAYAVAKPSSSTNAR